MLDARPHDLLRLAGSAALPAGAPAWAVHALRRTPWVVVRRATAVKDLIAVGVRGSDRSERYGTYVAPDDVRGVVPPEALTQLPAGRDLPAMRTLQAVRPLLDDAGLRWGPTGSIGFELATGQPTATPDSDLDLLVRTSDVVAALPVLTRLRGEFRALAVRVDCQIETSMGAVALAEIVAGQPVVLLRTPEGPRLVARAAVP
jgi:phosphoribosyl-dephospho-CoA transferase